MTMCYEGNCETDISEIYRSILDATRKQVYSAQGAYVGDVRGVEFRLRSLDGGEPELFSIDRRQVA